jgi:hypothetical protein
VVHIGHEFQATETVMGDLLIDQMPGHDADDLTSHRQRWTGDHAYQPGTPAPINNSYSPRG